MPTYEVTYTFEGHYSGTPTEVLERYFGTLANLQAEGIDIEHLGGTVTLGAVSGIRRIEFPMLTSNGSRDESRSTPNEPSCDNVLRA